jgi:hypothetical protein
MEVPLPQTKQSAPEKTVETKKPLLKSYKKVIPKFQIKKPIPIPKPKIIETIKPKTLTLSPPPMPPISAEEKKPVKPITKPEFNKVVSEPKQSWLNVFKKDKGIEIKPPAPPELAAKK